MAALRERVVFQVKKLRDFLDHLTRVDRVYYFRDGAVVTAIAGGMMWEGDLSREDRGDVERLERVLESKGVELARVMDAYEAADYLRSRFKW